MPIAAAFRTNYNKGTPNIPPEEVAGFPIYGYSCCDDRSIHPNSPNVIMALYFWTEADKNAMKAHMNFVKDMGENNGSGIHSNNQ